MPQECLGSASCCHGWSREVNTSIGLTTLTSKVMDGDFGLSEDLDPVFFRLICRASKCFGGTTLVPIIAIADEFWRAHEIGSVLGMSRARLQ